VVSPGISSLEEIGRDGGQAFHHCPTTSTISLSGSLQALAPSCVSFRLASSQWSRVMEPAPFS
jgi:hypothetical protein